MMRSNLEVLFFLSVFCLTSPHFAYCEDDTPCLSKFKSTTVGAENLWNLGNTSKGSLCSLTGVRCWNDQENKVLGIALSQTGLSGSFPSGLDLCISLQELDLSHNAFDGPIPSDLCSQMPYLVKLDLSDNQFTGQIPNTLGNCTYLNSLKLGNNQLSGELPANIGTLPRLKELDVSSNPLRGAIPASYASLPASAFDSDPGLCGPPLSRSCSSSSTNVALIVGVTIGVAAVVAILLALCVWWVILRAQKKEQAVLKDEHKWAKRIKGPKSITVSLFAQPLVKLKLSDLMAATNDFSKDNIIGTGRTGTVYKASLPDGSVLAIKRLSSTPYADKVFISEINTLGELRHRNLVPLLGYCVAAGEKLLVYKHMVNGSLKDYLHDSPEKRKPDWTSRLRIGIGAARGLAWLHHGCKPKIIHRNISTSSILVDDEYEARITDFGLARMMNPVDTHVSTFVNGDFGDVGYVAPEYVRTLVATLKGDVYSFGIVLLELVTGEKAVDVCAESGFKGNLAEWIAYLSNNGRTQEAIDMSLKGKGADDELIQFFRIACACVLSTPKDRPNMYEVYQLLRAIGEKFDITDNDELPPYADTKDVNDTEELIVAYGK